MICLSFCGGPLFGWFVNKGIQLAPLSHASVMVPTLTMLITLFIVFIQGKSINKHQLIGAFIIVIGLIALVSGKFDSVPNPLEGDIFFLAAAMLWSGFTLLLSKWKMPVFQSVVMINIISGLVYFPFFLIQSHHSISQIPALDWLCQSLVQGVLSAIIVIYAYSQAVKFCGVEIASMLPALIPITSLFTNFIFTDETPKVMVIGSLTLIMVGFITATRESRDGVVENTDPV
ncbi:DMT family transporter [Vibrio sp. YIC-376]|uniref:DMT family transporter n=1 Tax=Vibrio sp. YIC-376 TaxID=3136162 RepID=UPI00402AD600